MSLNLAAPAVEYSMPQVIHRPSTLDEALEMCSEMPDAEVVAGATWLMRSAMRGVPIAADLILLNGIAELTDISKGDPMIFGSMVTLNKVSGALEGESDLAALREAAYGAATPALRRVITLGGSIGAIGFHESDIVPALLCLDAQIILAGDLITEVRIRRSKRVSVHERLTWRSGGGYSVATVSISADLHSQNIRVALGSVEEAPRRWESVENALAGVTLTPSLAATTVQDHLCELSPMSSPGIPASYRLYVLPTVMARAVERLMCTPT